MMLKICFLLVGYFTLAICIRPENSAPTTVDSNEITALELMNYNESRNFIWNSDLPDRIQWSHNYGYCGEVSMIMACLKYGQYFSQYDVRDIAVVYPGDNKQSGGHWYSIGQNDKLTSDKMRLNYIEYTDYHADKREADVTDYIAWMKTMTRKGYAVTVCVYMNHYLFYGSTDPDAGYKEYDHIVSIYKIESNYDDNDYHDDDIITISDHGLWSPYLTGPKYYFSFVAKDFIGNRQSANAKGGNLYTIPDTTFSIRNYGIAQLGIVDELNECLDVRVETDVNYESPQIGILSEVRPTPMKIVLTVTVSGLKDGEKYTLFKYNDETKIPAANFAAHKENAIMAIDFAKQEGKETFVITETIMSDQKAIYRAVRV